MGTAKKERRTASMIGMQGQSGIYASRAVCELCGYAAYWSVTNKTLNPVCDYEYSRLAGGLLEERGYRWYMELMTNREE